MNLVYRVTEGARVDVLRVLLTGYEHTRYGVIEREVQVKAGGPLREGDCLLYTSADAGIIPLGIPMLAGPAAISTVMVLIGESKAWWQHVVVYAAILVSSLVSYWIRCV